MTAAQISDPAFHWDDLHEVISQSDRKNRHRRHIKHRVELADWPDNWDVLEVLVEELIHTTREVSSIRVSTIIWQATERHKCELAL